MIHRRRVLLAAALLSLPAAVSQRALAAASPVAAISSFCDALLDVMKHGPQLGFAGRRDRLAPEIERTFDFPRMTRLMVGPQWTNLSTAQQEQLVHAFRDFSIATYASRFDDYSGERFQVDPNPTVINGGMIVRTKILRTDDEPVQIDYLVHDEEGTWQVVDVYLSGTISELATRRSEFSSVMRRGGAEALVDLLQRKAAQLKG